MLVPLYGFLEGDTIGVLVLAHHDDTIARVAEKLVSAAAVRVAPPAHPRVFHRGRSLDPGQSVRQAGLTPLERIDVAAVAE
jgi:hypothetical protein